MYMYKQVVAAVTNGGRTVPEEETRNTHCSLDWKTCTAHLTCFERQLFIEKQQAVLHCSIFI